MRRVKRPSWDAHAGARDDFKVPTHSVEGAESAYLFRHAMLREAAYQLQLPGERARRHADVIAILEAVHGGPPPRPRPGERPEEFVAHPLDAFAAELADHARASDGPCRDRGRLYLFRAASYAESRFRMAEARALWRRLAVAEAPALRPYALRRAGRAALQTGDPSEARVLLKRALSKFRARGDCLQECLCLNHLCRLCLETGRLGEERAHIERMLFLSEALRSLQHLGNAHQEMGILHHEEDRGQEAERSYERALALHVQAKDLASEGATLTNLGALHSERGRNDLAEDCFVRAVTLHRSSSNRRMEGISLGNLATLYLRLRRMAEAEEAFHAAIVLHAEVGIRRHAAIAGGNLAILHMDTGRLESAREGFERALARHRECDNRRFEGAHSCYYAICLLRSGRRAEAAGQWRHGMAILRALGDDVCQKDMIGALEDARARFGLKGFEPEIVPEEKTRRTSRRL